MHLRIHNLRIKLLLGFLLSCFAMQAQLPVPFTIRYQNTLKGDMTIIANNIVNRDTNNTNPNDPYNSTGNGSDYNDDFDMRYIDVDSDGTTFSSSKATLTVPNIACSKIVYAGLYWSATYRYNGSNSGSGRATDFNQIKFKLPGATAYTNITGQVIFDGFTNTDFDDNSPYACYANVTGLLTALANPNGEYTVANVRATQADLTGGVSGGWTLFIVYENPQLTGKHITSYDGFAGVNSGVGNLDIPYSGFITVPAPQPVYAKIMAAALEGDNKITGDRLRFKTPTTAFSNISNTNNPATNFFNSNITISDVNFLDRVPNSLNTLGYDTDIVDINNLIPNGSTSATLRITSDGDQYYMFLNALSVDVIEPEIQLVKTVQNLAGQNIGGTDVGLGTVLDYVLTFDNIGNDNATNFTINDILPVNTSLQNISVVGAPGVTFTQNPTTGQITFTIPNGLVEVSDPAYTIRIRVQVANSCAELTDACSNIIQNQAYSTYRGVYNTAIVSNDPSVAGVGTCGQVFQGPANFLVDVDNCTFARQEVLCGASIVLTAPDGYASYEWHSGSPTGPVIGTTQSITVTTPGEYYVINTPTPPCIGLTEHITVVPFGSTTSNPIIPIADEVVICPNDGEELPNIFLCGINDTRLIETFITDATSIVWEKLNEASCPAVALEDCANKNPLCVWDPVGTGANFTATVAGQYRLIINYQNGCFNRYYFNVYANLLDPHYTSQNIICNTPGQIAVTNVPSSYEYQLIDQATGTVLVPYQNNPVFSITTAGVYTVLLRQQGVTDGCVFTLPNIGIMNTTLSVNIITESKDCHDLGSIRLHALNVRPQYYFTISGPVTLTQGPITDNNFIFEGLNPGTYNITVTTDDGCTFTGTTTVLDDSDLDLVASVSQHISCNQGNIQMSASGGQTPYTYAIYSYNGVLQNPALGDFQTSVIFDIPIGEQGDYVFIVKDSNNCTTLSNEVTINLVPDVQVTQTVNNVTCNGASNGSILLAVSNTQGFNVSFQLLNSVGTVIATNTSGSFTGLAPGDYTVNLTQTKGNKTCTFTYNYTITQPAPLTGTASVTQNYTCTTGSATISVNVPSVTGGVAPYQYSINGITFGSATTFTGLTAGTYTVTIRDANGCTFQTNASIIPPLTPPTDIQFSATGLTCAATTSTVTLTVTGGQTPLNYAIIAPAGAAVNNGTNNIFAGLAAGTYTFRITDGKGCTYQENYTINPLIPIAVTGNPVSNVTCFGSANGSLTYNVSGFSTNYSYTVVNGGGTTVASSASSTNATLSLTGLVAGTYTITVTDNVTLCTATVPVTIGGPAAALAVSNIVSPLTCITNGSVTITATGGWGGYEYQLQLPGGTIVGPQSSNIFSNLSATGTYTISVRDSNNCIVTNTFNITTPTPPDLTIAASSDICFDANGASITVTATGGQAPYTYSINGGPAQASATFANLSQNASYTIIVTDAYGCTDTVTQAISQQLTASASLVKGLDCTASPDAQIGVTIGGGLAPFTYQVAFNGGAYGAPVAVVGNTFTYTTGINGAYQFQITDAANCIVQTGTTNIAPLTQPAITSVTQTQDVICYGETTGAINVVINTTVGVGPYTIEVINTTTSQNFGTQTSGLPAGNYSITVTDSNSCESAPVTITISQPLPLIYTHGLVPIQCSGSGYIPGQISMTALSGGTGPYTYYISNNFGWNNSFGPTPSLSHSFDILNYGIYEIEVVDANGCSYVISDIIMASPPEDLLIDVTTLTTDCSVGGTAVVTVNPDVSSNNYSFAVITTINDPASIPAGDWHAADSGTPLTATFTGLIPGVTYTFVVRDNVTGCYYVKEAEQPINTPSTLTSVIGTVNNVTCTGSGDGNVTFTIDNYSPTTTQVSYQIYQSQSNQPVGAPVIVAVSGGPVVIPNIGPLVPDTYFILFTEVDGSFTGCSVASVEFTITESTNLLEVTAVSTANDNCGTNQGIITATGQYGTAPYTYMILPAASAAPTVGTWTGTTANVFNVEGGSYHVYVKDAYNCIQRTVAPVTVVVDPAPALTLAVASQCNTAQGAFTIQVTRTGGMAGTVFTYSLNGGAFQPQADTFTYTNLTSGTYTVVIRDSNNCTATQNITIYPPLNLAPAVTTQPTCALNDGVITVTPSGGSGNYQYELQDTLGAVVVAAQASNIFSGIAPGNYNVVIIDGTSTCTEEVAITLEVPTPVTFTLTSANVNCNGSSDGSITVTLPASNNNPAYTYTLDNGVTTVTQATPVFTGLPAGSYTVTVTSGRNCSDSETVVITEPAVLDVTATATEFACAADNSVQASVITATATGGTAPFTYSIDGTNFFTSNTFNIIDNGSAQNITVTVRDNNNCTDTFPITINPLPEIASVAAVQSVAITCTNDETVQINVTGGSGDFTFELLPSGSLPPVTGATASFDLTQPGSYTFQVTDNETGCYMLTIPYEVLPFDTLDVVATASTQVTCFGGTDGTITINVTGYTGNYDYEVISSSGTITGSGSTTVNPFTITNLPAGNHIIRITATGTPFCTEDSNTITVPSPASALTLTANQAASVTCDGNAGEIVASATGGWGTYEYQLVNNTTSTTIQAYAANSVFTGLTAGNYTVSVRDAGGCIVTQTITLTQPALITATLDAPVTQLLCYGDNTATVSVINVTGGEGVYQYILNTYDTTGTTIISSTGGQTSAQFTGLGAGIYSITVTDSWNCDLTTPTVTITQPAPLLGFLSLTDTLSCTTQAEITISATGGTAPYQYSTDGVTYTSTTVYSVGAGTYQYYVRDNNGCTAVMTNQVTILPIEPLNLNMDLAGAEINCYGETTAVISANPTGGLGNYMFELLDGSHTLITGPQAGNTFAGLGAGTYYVRVVSGDCNEESAAIAITNPTVLDVTYTKTDVLCFGDSNGTIEITTTGGTGTVQYAISPNLNQFVNNNLFENLAPGMYDLVVQDQNGCFETLQIEILQPDPLVATFGTIVDEVCLNAANGSITVDIIGGTGDYEVSIDNLAIDTDNPLVYVPVTGNQHVFNNLTGDTAYWIYVRDSNGCNVNPPLEYYMYPPVFINPTVTVVDNCTNNVPGNIVTVSTDASVVGAVEFAVDGGAFQTSDTFTNLAPGSHTVAVQHTNGCVQTTTFTINNLAPVAASVSSVTNVLCFGNATGAITVTGTGGTGTLEYAISPAYVYGASNTFTGLAAGTYTIRVRDAISCEVQLTNIAVTQPAAALATTEVHTDEICLNAADGTVTLTITGGTAPYSTAIDSSDPADLQVGVLTYPGLAAGTHTIYVTDANGCSITPMTFTILPGVSIQPTASVVENCTANVPGNVVTVSVNAVVVASVQYSLDNVTYQAANTFTNLAPGNYTAYVRHTNGCVQTTTFTINNLAPVAASVSSVTNVLCFGNATGAITVTGTGGTGTLEYAISPAYVYGTSNTFTGLAAGTYTIRVRDAISCEVQLTNIVVTQPAAALATTEVHTDEICLNAADGTVTLTITGGTAPYSTAIDSANPADLQVGVLTYPGLAAGTHTIYVTDANGCSITPLTFTILPGVSIQPTASVVENCTANVPGNVVTVSVNAAVAASVQYSLDNVTYQASNTFTNLAPGNYTAYVRHTNGCVQTTTFTINNLAPVAASVSSVTNVLCFGNATGAITVTGTGGTGTLEYAISPAYVYGTSNTFTGLAAGTYTIRVRDAISCEVQLTNIAVTQPAAALATTEVHTDEICLNAADGTVTLTITGGTAPYSTAIDSSDPADLQVGVLTYPGLAAGTHTIYVTDANGCSITPMTFTILPGVNILPTVEIIPTCTGNTPGNVVFISVDPAVIADVEYSLDGVTYDANNAFGDVPAGTHTAYVQHTNGCIQTVDFTIDNLLPIGGSVTLKTNVPCFGDSTGEIEVTGTGGTGALQYAISPSFTYGPDNTFAGLTAGTYEIRITDEIGCEFILSNIVVDEPAAALATTEVHTDEICLNAADGTVTLTITGGTAPYSTAIDSSDPADLQAGVLTYPGLAAGTHTIYVTDANGCSITPLTFTILPGVSIQPTASVVENCTANVPGNVVTVSVNAAVAASVQYSLDNVTYQAANTFTNLAPGTYTAYVRHTNGCVQTTTFTINNLAPVAASVSSVTNVLCFGNATGAITVTGTGGTGTLEYAISPAYVYGTSNTFTGLAAGTYTIRVRDAISCEVQLTNIAVTQPAAALATTEVHTDEICLNAADGTVTLTITGGTAPYSTAIDSANPADLQVGVLTYPNLAAGTHTIYVTDANGCSITPLTFTILPGVSIQPTASVVENCTANVPGNVVTINTNASVIGAIQFSLDGGAYQASNIFNNVAPGNHTVEVQHTNGCIQPVTFDIQNRLPIAGSIASTTDVLCFGAATGEIEVSVTGGTGTIEYAISPAYVYGTSNTFTGLVAGTYTIMVRDNIGCEVTLGSVIINEPSAVLSASAVPSNETCVNAADGSIAVTVSGGTAPYFTSLTNNPADFVQDQFSFTGLADGQYTVYVKDANNCEVTPIVVTIAPGIDIQPSVSVVENCTANVPGNVVTVSVNAAVAADVEYSLDNVTWQNGNTFTNVAPGTYTVYVQHTNGCIETQPLTILNRLPITASIASTTDVLCFGEATGEIEVSATGGTGTIEYAISPAFVYGTNNTFTGLTAGTYTVMVRDALGCEQTFNNITISEPSTALTASAVASNETCVNAADGSIAVTVSGGTAPYFTSLTNNPADFVQDQFSFTGLADGQYTVYVKDANNCEVTPIVVTIAPGIDIQPSVSVVENCTANVPGNVVTVTVNAAVAANVQYSLDNVTWQSGNTFTNVAPGTYTVYIQHTNGCTETRPLTIQNRLPITASIASTTDVLCFGGATGEIQVSATGGTGTIEYAISPAFVYGTNNTFTGLTAGTYTVMVRDALGCERTFNNILISAPSTALTASAVPTAETCFNEADGSIAVTVSGGTAPYFTSLTNNPADFVQDQFSFTGLTGGQYTVYVRDANGCIVAPITVDVTPGVNINPTAQVVNNCTGNTPGNLVTVSVNPAVASQVQYSLDNVTWQNSYMFTNLTPGNHTIYVKHTNGCTQTVTVNIQFVRAITASAIQTGTISCGGGNGGAITVTAAGGTGTLEYAISPNYVYGTSNVFTGLAAGTYTIRVRDELGCELQLPDPIVITQPAPVVATYVVTGETCLHSNNGSVTISVSGGTAPYSTSMDGVNYTQGQFTFSNLQGQQQYVVFVRDAMGCTTLAPIVFTVPNGVVINPSVNIAFNCSNNVLGNTITVNTNPAVAGQVEFSLDGINYQSSNVFTNLPTGQYMMYVRHANGCVRQVPFTIELVKPIDAIYDATDIICNGGTSTITVTGAGGIGALEYGISPDFEMSSNNVFTDVPAGNYTIRVEDSLGCFHEFPVPITEPDPIQVTLVSSADETCEGDNNGEIEIAISGGTGPYSTSMDQNANYELDKRLYSGLDGGVEYIIYVKDANGCLQPFPVSLGAPITLNPVAVVNYACQDNNITVTVDAAVEGSVMYSLNGGDPQTSNVFNDLPAGHYSVEVVHTVHGCWEVSNQVEVVATTPLGMTLSISGINEITAGVFGGTGGYTFTFNGQDMGSDNVYEITATGTYEVTVTDSSGCPVTQSIYLEFIDIIIPDVVTPNNDGVNDGWGPGNTANYPYITSDIFDRYGRKVATLRQGQTWDGKYNGVELPTGDYWYIIKLGNPGDNREFIGHFTIYR